MSFAAETKNELAHVISEKRCCMLAELAGFIRICGSLRLGGGGKITVVTATENLAVVRRYKKMIKDYFGSNAEVEIEQGASLKRTKTYLLVISPEERSEEILRETGILLVRQGLNAISDGIYEGLVKTKCCKKAYLRGLFLGAGTISDPEKAYHLEIVCNTQVLAGDVKKLINSFVDLRAKSVQRKKNQIVYVKESGQIIDILNIMGAHSHLLVFENVKIIKEMRNKANRVLNCDSANLDKTIQASQRQVAQIRKIEEKKGLGLLSEKLYQVAVLRLENPEASLVELAEMMDPPLKKSGINHRFKKIEEMARRL